MVQNRTDWPARRSTRVRLTLLLALAALASPCVAGAQSNPGENTLDWLRKGNNFHGAEAEPEKALIPTEPFKTPKPGDMFYDAKIELWMQGANPSNYARLYRRGVFVGYVHDEPHLAVEDLAERQFSPEEETRYQFRDKLGLP